MDGPRQHSTAQPMTTTTTKWRRARSQPMDVHSTPRWPTDDRATTAVAERGSGQRGAHRRLAFRAPEPASPSIRRATVGKKVGVGGRRAGGWSRSSVGHSRQGGPTQKGGGPFVVSNRMGRGGLSSPSSEKGRFTQEARHHPSPQQPTRFRTGPEKELFFFPFFSVGQREFSSCHPLHCSPQNHSTPLLFGQPSKLPALPVRSSARPTVRRIARRQSWRSTTTTTSVSALC